ncbi:MAG TPA: response regulator [Anaerolineae bacterium]|nr:response regulator [Anaerolineae bacterium]
MSKKRVLYIEDNFENRLFVRRVLESMGLELLEAEDGMTGIEVAQNESPDLILMDIGLPGMDGLETTTRIRQDQEIKDIPIIALTANAMKGDAERCLAAGCDIYLTKPIGVTDLKEKVLEFLD